MNFAIVEGRQETSNKFEEQNQTFSNKFDDISSKCYEQKSINQELQNKLAVIQK